MNPPVQELHLLRGVEPVLAAGEQRPVVLRLIRRAVLAVDVDEGGNMKFGICL